MSDVHPDIVAAIAASISCVMEEANVTAELLAAITAAVVHHSGGVHAVRIKHGSNAWALAGRQKIMDSRQFA